MQKILIADDNQDILHILKTFAEAAGYETRTAKDGLEALNLFQAETFDIILLDVMMPKLDGFSLCKKIREKSNAPIILITAKGDDYDKIMGLDIGADDYVVKPFSPAEVMARVRAALRRVEPQTKEKGNVLRSDNLTLDIDARKITIDGENIPLTRKEFDLLLILFENKSRTFSREHLLDRVWGPEYMGETRAVDTHIKRLRAKLDKHEHPKWRIKTSWGVGYSFEEII